MFSTNQHGKQPGAAGALIGRCVPLPAVPADPRAPYARTTPIPGGLRRAQADRSSPPTVVVAAAAKTQNLDETALQIQSDRIIIQIT